MRKSWLLENKSKLLVGLLIASPLLWFVLAPFPGLGFYYQVRDNLRGHPQAQHGSRPQNFVGLWIREESVRHDFLGQAFYLMPDGTLASIGGMTLRRWHFDQNRLFVDSVSLCGNCYRGNCTTEYTVRFVGRDEMIVTNRDNAIKRGIAGRYVRTELNDELRSRMTRLTESGDELESFRARAILKVIKNYEWRAERD